MTEDQRLPWAQTTVGALAVAIVASVIGSVVGTVTGIAVSNPPTPGVETPIDVTPSLSWIIAGGSVGLVLASILFRRVRSAIWGNVGRSLRWLGGIRLTSRTMREGLIQRGYAVRNLEQHQLDLEAARAANEQSAQVRAIVSDIVSKPPLPAPTPRWIVQRVNGEPTKVFIRNAVDRSVAREVRLESEFFDFLDGAHWAELSGGSESHFNGRVRAQNGVVAITFLVSWYDGQGKAHSETVWMRLDDGWTPF